VQRLSAPVSELSAPVQKLSAPVSELSALRPPRLCVKKNLCNLWFQLNNSTTQQL
jgi:hypothetical protein